MQKHDYIYKWEIPSISNANKGRSYYVQLSSFIILFVAAEIIIKHWYVYCSLPLYLISVKPNMLTAHLPCQFSFQHHAHKHVYMIVCDSSCVRLLIVQWILSGITAGSLMVRTPINQVRRPINQGLIVRPNLAITVRGPLKCQKSRKEMWSCRESNSGPSAFCVSALPLSYNSHHQPPLNHNQQSC